MMWGKEPARSAEMREEYLRTVKVDKQKKEETYHIWGRRVGKRYVEEKKTKHFYT